MIRNSTGSRESGNDESTYESEVSAIKFVESLIHSPVLPDDKLSSISDYELLLQGSFQNGSSRRSVTDNAISSIEEMPMGSDISNSWDGDESISQSTETFVRSSVYEGDESSNGRATDEEVDDGTLQESRADQRFEQDSEEIAHISTGLDIESESELIAEPNAVKSKFLSLLKTKLLHPSTKKPSEISANEILKKTHVENADFLAKKLNILKRKISDETGKEENLMEKGFKSKIIHKLDKDILPKVWQEKIAWISLYNTIEKLKEEPSHEPHKCKACLETTTEIEKTNSIRKLIARVHKNYIRNHFQEHLFHDSISLTAELVKALQVATAVVPCKKC